MTERSTKKILVADDDPLTRTIIEDILIGAGYAVSLVADGIEAIEEIQAYPDGFDLLVLDPQMEKADGFKVLDRLGEKDLLGKLHVLIMTGAYEPAEVIKHAEVGRG